MMHTQISQLLKFCFDYNKIIGISVIDGVLRLELPNDYPRYEKVYIEIGSLYSYIYPVNQYDNLIAYSTFINNGYIPICVIKNIQIIEYGSIDGISSRIDDTDPSKYVFTKVTLETDANNEFNKYTFYIRTTKDVNPHVGITYTKIYNSDKTYKDITVISYDSITRNYTTDWFTMNCFEINFRGIISRLMFTKSNTFHSIIPTNKALEIFLQENSNKLYIPNTENILLSDILSFNYGLLASKLNSNLVGSYSSFGIGETKTLYTDKDGNPYMYDGNGIYIDGNREDKRNSYLIIPKTH